jgi:hypothetical protein
VVYTVNTKDRSNLRVRTRVPSIDLQEPFATLQYGNVTVEIPYTDLEKVKLNDGSEFGVKSAQLFSSAIRQMIFDMRHDMGMGLDPYHRDGERFDKLPMSHNPLHREDPGTINEYVFYED